MKVFILATCRKPKYLRFTTLVFETLRIGFPTAIISIRNNGLTGELLESLRNSMAQAGAELEPDTSETIHHKWIESLIERETEPFWICDTDMVFYDKVEDWKFETAIAGYRVPEWQYESVEYITRSRLHGSLLYIDPVKLKASVSSLQIPKSLSEFAPLDNLIYPSIVPLNGRLYFYDTCAKLYHLISGTAFTSQQKDAYFHFNFGTIPDIILPLLSDQNAIQSRRDWVLEDTARGKGLWKEQELYYSERPPQPRAPSFSIKPISDKNASEAIIWNRALCRDNKDAMNFCDLWYSYCHIIDDLIDTLEDSRPTMSKADILSIFFNAAFLYNCAFYRANASLLFPVVLTITNTYADSVAWENSPIYRRRIMSDVLRMAGNEMYFIVALICGGQAHMRDMSLKIRERDWIGQHDEHDNPN